VLYPIETWECLNAAAREAVQSGVGYDLELPALRSDGTPLWINTRCIAEHDINGDVCGLRGTLQDITQRKQSDLRVHFQAKLLNAIGQAVIATDVQGTVTYINGAAESLYGWPSAKAIGRSILEVTVPDVSQSQAIEIMGQLTAGRSWSGEFSVQRSDGSIFTAEVHDTPIVDAAGKLIGVIGVSSDISLRKETERLLAQSQGRYETVVTALSEGVVLLRRDGAIVSCNPAAERILGLSDNQLRASKGFDPSWQAIHEDGSPCSLESLPGSQALKTGMPQQNVIMGIRKPGGAKTWISINAVPIFDSESPKPSAAVVSFADITERKLAKMAVQEERDRLAALIRSMQDEVWFADTKGQFTLVNPKGDREFTLGDGSSQDVRKLAESLEVLRPDGSSRPVDEAPPLRALRGELVTRQQEIVRTPVSGKFRHREVSAAPVRDSQARIIGSVSVVRDVTERNRLEQALLFRAVGRAGAGEQEAQVVVDLCHGAHGGARVVAGGLLLDRDGGRQALDHVHIGLVHQLQKLAGVGGQALHVAALALGVQRVECQAGLARTAQTRDHHQLVAWDVEVDILQVVGARTPDADGLLLQCPGKVGAVSWRVQGHGPRKRG
jgi:PAS domain S-box-containing protein